MVVGRFPATQLPNIMWGILVLFCFAAVAANDEDQELVWPEKYSYEIKKYSILSDIVEDITFWKSKTEKRAEYNNGAVKNYVKGSQRRYTEYELHPETEDAAKGKLNKMVCHSHSRRGVAELSVLPPLEDLEMQVVGQEQLKDENCTKFYKELIEDNLEKKYTLWALYDRSVYGWYPVRYEYQAFNIWLGYKSTHEIWEFENYNTDFNESVFDLPEECKEEGKPIRHKMNSEGITKHLLFMDPHNKAHVDHVFNTFKRKHGKQYSNKTEHILRKSIFQDKMRLIKETNRRNVGYKLAVNHFADRTPNELKPYRGLKRRNPGEGGTHPFPYDAKRLSELASDLPAEYDLRVLGLVSPVHNQGDCGSCWTFGTTSAVEGALARSNGGKLKHLANQALVDCAWEFHAYGCGGGNDVDAYKWMQKYGMPTVADYGTYSQADGFCKIENMTTTYKIKGFVDVTPNSEGALKVAVMKHGPLSVSIDATDAFLLYSGGIFYDIECSPDVLNHEITLVGYGESYGETYWIVKNSYGPDWGLGGFMHISARNNNCGIMTEPTYVLF